MAQPGLEKHNQFNTPIRTTFITQEKVAIIDPCHPLYGQEFPLLHLTNHHQLEPCCLVEIIPGVDRLIPIRQTNLSPSETIVFPCPVDISSFYNLVKVFQKAEAQIEMECCDGSRRNQLSSDDCNSPAESMGNLGCKPAKAGNANNRQSVSANDGGVETGGKE